MRSGTRGIHVVLIALLMAAVPDVSTESQANETLGNVFARYAKGQYGEVDEALRKIPVTGLLEEFRLLANRVSAGTPGSAGFGGAGAESAIRRRNQRRLAAFAVEAAYASIHNGGLEARPRQNGEKSDPPAYVDELVAWGRERLGRVPPQDTFVQRWYQTAIGTFEAAQIASSVEQWAEEGLQLFPRDPTFLLARGVAIEIRTSPYRGSSASVSTRQLREATERFTAAMAFGETRGEAELRLGHTYARASRYQEALTYLRSAETNAEDPALKYLARVFKGRIQLTSDQPAAVAEFERALELVPGSQSATMGLAAARLLQLDRSGAHNLIDVYLRNSAISDDPWWTYWIGAARRWQDLVRSLRLELE